jgi:hypothetical protein
MTPLPPSTASRTGFATAWAGHFLFEHNTPATFTKPLYGLRGDLTLLGEVLSGRRRW